MRRKTTDEIFTEAMLRLGYVDVPIGYTPPRRKRKPKAQRRKTVRNGKAR